MSKAILFKLALKGNGVVNFDSASQKYMLEKCGIKIDTSKANYKLAKKSFTNQDGEEKVASSLKISSTCLRHSLFEDDYKATNPTISRVDVCLADFISSVSGLLRGYMFTASGSSSKEDSDEDKGESFILKSPITLTNAEECTGAIPIIEVNSPSVPKTSTEDSKATPSFYFTENVGDVAYQAKGVIDFKQMQFMSDDPFLGRVSFKKEWLEGGKLFDKVFMNHYGRIPYTAGFFTATKSVFGERIAEHGVKFDEGFVRFLVCEALKRLLSISIKRAGAYAETSSLRIKVVNNSLEDKFSSEDGWETVTPELIEKLSKELVIDDFYISASDKLVKETREEIAKQLEIEKKAEEIRKKKESAKKSGTKTKKE